MKKFFFNIWLLTFGLSVPLLVSVCSHSIYIEAISWGLCWSIWGICFTILILSSKQINWLCILGLAFSAGFALLSRVTFGVPLYLVLFLFLVTYLLKDSRVLSKFLIFISPALICLAFQLWYNYDRFGSITTFIAPQYNHYLFTHPCYPNFFDIRRIPTALVNYLGFTTEYFSAKPPYINFTFTKLNPDLCFGNKKIVSLLVTSPWLIWGTIIGLIMLFKQKNKYLHKICAIIFSSSILIILPYVAIGQRHTTEFLPFMVFMYSFYILHLQDIKFFSKHQTSTIIFTTIICAVSIITSLLVELQWEMYLEEKRQAVYSMYHFIEKNKGFFFPGNK